MAELRSILAAISLPKETSSGWLGYIKLRHAFRDNKFALRLGLEREQIVSEIGDKVWDFFMLIREPLEAANDAFAAGND